MRHSKEYGIWVSMRNRCSNPNVKAYANYGGRGIKVCDRWQSFENFYADMGARPDGMTLERIDNDGDYEPSNVRWATRAEQANNKRNNRLLSFDGVTKTLAQWADGLGVSHATLVMRLKQGWPIDKAVTLPQQNKRSGFHVNTASA